MKQINWHGSWNQLFLHGLDERWSSLLKPWLLEQRWYLEKEMPLTGVQISEAWKVKIDEKTVWWLLIECATSSGIQVYQLPLVLLDRGYDENTLLLAEVTGTETGYVADAWTWLPFVRYVLSLLHLTSMVPVDRAAEDELYSKPFSRMLYWRHDGPYALDVPIVPLPATHSNTSFRLGDQYFLKVPRQVNEGVQPEIEMGHELSKRGSKVTIPLLADLRMDLHGRSITLATLAGLVASEGNGWDWILQQAMKTHDPLEHANLTEAVSLLGQRTAQLHHLLAQPCVSAAFSPEPFSEHDHHDLLDRIHVRLQHVNQLLQQHAASTARGQALIWEWLRMDFQNIPGNSPFSKAHRFMKHRIHGDYHLGQVLRTVEDWKIIDFEGEPLRPLAERRAKDLPIRDVAGMVRSLEYAQAYSIMQHPEQAASLQPLFLKLSVAFLESYSFHSDSSVRDGLIHYLRWYILEKTLYEVEYEIRSRPAWLSIPLEGLLAITRSSQETPVPAL